MHNKTSEKLTASIPEIMNLWEERTLKEVQAANLQETLALRNSLPIYLTQLADALSTTIDRTHARNSADKKDSTRIGQKHGRERATAFNYTIDQMILEYHILRQVICDVLETDMTLSNIELEVIICSIEQAVNDAATQYSDTLRELQEHISQTLAHDLRNPLSTVRMSAQLISKKTNDEKIIEAKSKRIIQNVDRIDRMIQEILDESKHKHDEKTYPAFNNFDLAWLIEDVCFEMNISNDDRVQFQNPGECLGTWNEDGLRRMIENLITNALKYSFENTPVTITLENKKDAIIFNIHNEGEPIPSAAIPTLFDKFKRATTAKEQIGWGLGLSVVKKMAASHEGTIEVKSDKTSGTTFIVSLPKSPKE